MPDRVFKTAAINHSAIPPVGDRLSAAGYQQERLKAESRKLKATGVILPVSARPPDLGHRRP